MAQSGYTPISLYYSTTGSAVPVNTNLVNGELAINITDGKLYYKDNTGTVKLLASSSTSGGTFAAPVVIEGTTTDAALRITQLGTGNALLVEDSTNPDASPFAIDTDGKVLQGTTTNLTGGQVQFAGGITDLLRAGAQHNLNFYRANTSLSAPTTVNNAQSIGLITFNGYDGSSYIESARIRAEVDGTPGTSDMPGRLVFATTADGASSPTERMRIDSAGQVAIGSTTSTGQNLRVAKNLTGSTSVVGVSLSSTIQSDVTGQSASYSSFINTSASAFTLTSLKHYNAQQGTIGAGSAVTNQFGFWVDSSLTGANNNYGFYGNIASGTGRYNLYMGGTAANYFGGVTTIGKALQETKTAIGASDIDLSTGNFFSKTISGATTFTVSNVPTTGTSSSFILDLTNGGAGAITWWANVKWAGGTAPTLTASGRDSLGFYTYDAGTTWTGLVLGLDIK